MSKDDKDLELLNSSSTTGAIWTDEDSKNVLKEIKFDSWDANGSPITVTSNVQQSEGDAFTVHSALVSGGLLGDLPLPGGLGAEDMITVTQDDIKNLDASSNGTKQLDLFDTVDFDETKYLKED